MVDVSVVMSIYDEPAHVRKTIESVLAQQGVEFEFIIISDGASKEVLTVVQPHLSDQRILFFEQPNQGLTKALISACNHASAPFIARIDAGDEMLPSRLSKQLEHLKSNRQLGFVSSWVQLLTEEGYSLYSIKLSADKLRAGLLTDCVDQFCIPFHASVMFRKSVYDEVGGYRADFYFTQDADLWSRMIEVSEVDVIEEYLTSGIFSEKGISGRNAERQKRIKELIVQANQARNSKQCEREILDQIRKIRPGTDKNSEQRDNFDGLYFIANVLTDNGSAHANQYWLKAFKERPWNLKLYLSFIHSFWRNKRFKR